MYHKTLTMWFLKTTKNIVVFYKQNTMNKQLNFIIFLNAIISKQGKYNELS